ncbi:tetratricopeptide repeat protein [Novosphingobium sp. CF614]|uniref:SPOR domain-containing protein n=1 Tax=Novosphingobium sp. CF614 TaxID=1884364 RepID=UPI002100F773|nr:tetratricopeptide repeat protein [Novosphingobium sp. CF614]
MRVELKLWRLVAGAAAGYCLGWPGLALAQGAPVVSRPVVQSLPSIESQRLNAALARLGRDPRDITALIDAGEAARGLGDFDAAIGFYRRADKISPDNPRVKAGLAGAYVMTGDPVSAIPYFDAAEKAGAAPARIAADRGLAYDLVGDNATAQRYYAAAMAAGENDEARLRLALSQAMAGDQKSAEATLMPLLRKQDKPGWRARAFALAIGGDAKQAVDVAETILPPQLAESIAPYLRYMPRLTKAQQAAAANLGRFPRASEIGRDDARIAAYAPPRVAAADSGLVPKGEPLDGGRGAKDKKPSSRTRIASNTARAAGAQAGEATRTGSSRKTPSASADPDRVVPPEPRPAIESTGELPPIARSTALSPAAAQPAPAPAPSQKVALASAGAATTPPAPVQAATQAPPASPVKAPAKAPAPGFDLASLPATQGGGPAVSAAPAPTPAPASPPTPTAVSSAPVVQPIAESTSAAPPSSAIPAPAVPGPAQPSLAEIFADFGKPATQAAPVPGAVDISKIEPARPEPKPEPKVEERKPVEKPKPKKPAPPAHPSRIWVQIGVGRDKDAIAFDWRRRAKQAPALFKGRQAYVSDMGRTNRVLAGPFETQKAANQFIVDLKKAGIDDALPWTSPAGQVVDALPKN